MRSFEYGDEEIDRKEIFYAVAAVVIGVGILSLPRTIAQLTKTSDGWISLLIGGSIAIGVAFLFCKFAQRFPGETYFKFVPKIIGKPLGYIAIIGFSVYFLTMCAYEVRVISNVAKLYIFDRTPVEIISLMFLLVVIYAVTGSSTAALRLNLMFLPIIIVTIISIQLLSLPYIDLHSLQPVLVTPPMDLLKGTYEAYISFTGFEVILVYIGFMNRPKRAAGAVAFGLMIPLVLYILTYLFCIGIFSATTKEILYPTIEIAKEIDAPVSFFERFDSLFFTIWIMAIYTTAVMAFDVAVLGLRHIIPLKKFHWVIIMAPFIYLGAMLPQNYQQIGILGDLTTLLSLVFGVGLPAIIFIIGLIRGVRGEKQSDKNG